MNIKPLDDRVLLKEIKNGTNEKSFLYEVLAIGPGKKDTHINIKVSDKVLTGQYSGDDVRYNGEEYKIVGADYILAIVD